MPIFWDDLDILRALDELEGESRAYHGSGEDLLKKAARDQLITDEDRAAFSRQLIMLATQGRLTFDQHAFGARVMQPHEREFPQSLWHFQLTESGRDRARARVVYEHFPDPGEDDGSTIPGLVLSRVANLVAEYYSAQQVPRFLDDVGLISDQLIQLTEAESDRANYIYNTLTSQASGAAEERRVLRGFLAGLLNGVLDFVPTAEQRHEIASLLARAGWHLKGQTIVVGERTTSLAPDEESAIEPLTVDPGSAIFLVHGHNHDQLDAVSQFLRQVTDGHEVVILHEQANQGQTLIEKFERNAARAAHAVVLLTADDVGRPATLAPDADQPRGRQNVVLELGFFFGRLSRRHVTVLRDPGVEQPSDIAGLVYIELDPHDAWKLELAKDLKASGVGINLNKLVE
jgi:predicted nucleotide-binding protein